MTHRCFSPRTLVMFHANELDAAGTAFVRQHLEACSACQRTVQRLEWALDWEFGPLHTLEPGTPETALAIQMAWLGLRKWLWPSAKVDQAVRILELEVGVAVAAGNLRALLSGEEEAQR